MKILITTDLFTTATNGVVTSVKNLCSELEKAGHDVRILTLSQYTHSYRNGPVYFIRSVSLERIYPDIRMPTSYRHRMIRELIAWKPDVIHSQCEFFTMQYARYIAKRTGAPIVHTYHTLYEQYIPYLLPSRRLGNKVVKVVSRVRLKNVDRVIAPTQKVEQALRGYGMDGPISVIPSGLDLSQHRQRISDEEWHTMRQSLGIRDDQLVLLNLGRLGTEKKLDELVRLFAQAQSNYPDLVFLIVGDGPARASLQKLAEALDVADQVIFTGMVKPSDVQKYYQLGDIFVSASTSETQGLTYIEAAANGLPLLCRKDPCLQEVLFPGENGWTYETEEEFLSILDSIHADPRLYMNAGHKSREIAARFDKSVFGDSVEEVYASVVK